MRLRTTLRRLDNRNASCQCRKPRTKLFSTIIIIIIIIASDDDDDDHDDEGICSLFPVDH